MGPDYAVYYASGGTQGTKPDDPNILKMWDLFSEAASLKADGRNKNAQEIWKILVDQQIGIGTVGQSPAGLGVRLVSNKLGNIAVARLQRAALPHARQLACRRPGTSRPDRCWPISLRPPGAGRDHRVGDHGRDVHHPAAAAGRFRRCLCRAGVRHGHRDLRGGGGGAAPCLWAGPVAAGCSTAKWLNLIAHGDFGTSFEYSRPVTEVIGDRLWLTMLLSFARHHRDLGAGAADRHLLGGAAILDRRLRASPSSASSAWRCRTSCWR